MSQTLTALFDSRAEAQAAVDKLIAAGIGDGSARLVPGSADTYRPDASKSYDCQRDEGGFWAGLKDLFMPDEDRYTYSEGLSRGAQMVTVTVNDSDVDRAMDILEEHGSVDLDEREATWRKEGWSGWSSDAAAWDGSATGAGTLGAGVLGAGAFGAGALGAGDLGAGEVGTRRTASSGTLASDALAGTGSREDLRDEAIPVVQETLRVGKRAVEGGRVRVRSYVVETPVQEQVNLHSEHVTIDRRPVDRPLNATDGDLFRERTIEAVERDETAVVAKEARVTEEIGLRKDAQDRTETVSDKVRRTEVEIEDERGRVTRGGESLSTTKPVVDPTARRAS